MNKMSKIVLTLCLSLILVSCAQKYKKIEHEVETQPINCATAEGDIRVLESERAHVAQQILLGVTAITPPGLILGILTRTEKEKINVATGEYNKMLENKITEIKETCGIE